MSGVKIEPDVVLLELADCVGYELLKTVRLMRSINSCELLMLSHNVGALRIGALCDTQVRHEVGETIWFDDEDNTNIRVFWNPS